MLKTLLKTMTPTDAIKQIMFKYTVNRNYVTDFMREYEGETPYFSFVIRCVSGRGIPLFIQPGVNYAEIEANMMALKEGATNA